MFVVACLDEGSYTVGGEFCFTERSRNLGKKLWLLEEAEKEDFKILRDLLAVVERQTRQGKFALLGKKKAAEQTSFFSKSSTLSFLGCVLSPSSPSVQCRYFLNGENRSKTEEIRSKPLTREKRSLLWTFDTNLLSWH